MTEAAEAQTPDRSVDLELANGAGVLVRQGASSPIVPGEPEGRASPDETPLPRF